MMEERREEGEGRVWGMWLTAAWGANESGCRGCRRAPLADCRGIMIRTI